MRSQSKSVFFTIDLSLNIPELSIIKSTFPLAFNVVSTILSLNSTESWFATAYPPVLTISDTTLLAGLFPLIESPLNDHPKSLITT